MKNSTTEFSRRDFLYLSSLTAAGLLTGCAVNPVTGKSQLMLMSEEQEINIDRQHTPNQFSEDYGVSRDARLNSYLQQTGKRIGSFSHRPRMPYSFRCVNAVYVNAYAFPGGSIAVTRGVLLALDNEAELAALLGHELGHINARHTARQMSKGTLVQALAGGISILAGSYSRLYGQVASQLGSLGAGALLASYSRDNEREADDLALEYMTKAGYNPKGAVGLMEMLNRISKHNPNAIELMFATHPMNSERYETTRRLARKRYSRFNDLPLYRERYLDNTAGLRAMKGAIEEIQKGEKALAKKDLPAAEQHLKAALKQAPDDYAALTIMAKIMLIQKKEAEALIYSERAKAAYPQEAQAHFISGLLKVKKKKYPEALNDFSTYKKILPGNPAADFYSGLSLEGMQRREQAARQYHAFLQKVQKVQKGEQAQYAHKRLVEWGYYK